MPISTLPQMTIDDLKKWVDEVPATPVAPQTTTPTIDSKPAASPGVPTSSPAGVIGAPQLYSIIPAGVSAQLANELREMSPSYAQQRPLKNLTEFGRALGRIDVLHRALRSGIPSKEFRSDLETELSVVQRHCDQWKKAHRGG